ncbi:MAG: amidohydrolase family protein [Candidatus Dormibacteraeota bacterium]|nr:amidohydrolase family protein [Candidatus Dormibacteraeota bacterium]
MLIDMHAHVIPGEFPEVGGRAAGDRWPKMEPGEGGARVLVAGAMRFTAQQVWFDADRRLAAMDENGVDAELASPFPGLLTYGLEPQDGLDLARAINEYVARLCEVNPSRFFGLGTLPMQDPELAARELSAIRDMGLHGVEVASNIDGRSLGEERFLGFFQEAARLGVPVFVHALAPTFADRLPGPAIGSFGMAAEIALCAASLITSGTAEKCPDLRLAFSHGAGGFPLALTRANYFYSGTWNEEPAPPDRPARPNQAPHSPAEYARRFYYDSLVMDRRALRYLLDMIGPDRLLIGTDFPAMPREQPAGKTLRTLGLAEDVVEDITWRNCFRFLGVPAPSGVTGAVEGVR